MYMPAAIPDRDRFPSFRDDGKRPSTLFYMDIEIAQRFGLRATWETLRRYGDLKTRNPYEVTELYIIISTPCGYWHWTNGGNRIDCWGESLTAERFDTKAEAEQCIREEYDADMDGRLPPSISPQGDADCRSLGGARPYRSGGNVMRNCDILKDYDAAMAVFICQTNWRGYCTRPHITFGQWLYEDSEISRREMSKGRTRIDEQLKGGQS